jgi:hypothetical protein
MTIEAAAGRPRADPQAADRRFYLFMTVLIAVLAVVGFAPKSAGILAGALPNPPVVVHLHALAMVSWLLLLVAQAGLVSAGRRDLHMRLGLVSLGLVPAILVLGAMTTVVRYYDAVEVGQGAVVANILVLQLRFFIMFPIFVTWAMLARRRDPEMHKRMLIVASLIPLGAALGRMAWVPGNNVVVTNDVASLLELAMFAPVIAYDLVRSGRVHRAYVIGLALALPWFVFIHFVWNASWWKAIADALMGAPA